MSDWRRRVLRWLVGGDFLLVSQSRVDGGWYVSAELTGQAWEEINEVVRTALEMTER